MKCPPVAVVDFETKRIEPRPNHPPKPVGVAIKLPGERRGNYYAFGHPEGNNCTESQARAAYISAVRRFIPLCHEAGFDLDVAEVHWGVKWPAEHHDSKLMAFLCDPDAETLSLKPQAELRLGEPPEEQDRLKDWIMANVKTPDGGKPGEGKKSKHPWGAFISLAPVSIVGPYALGDVGRTERLFKFYWNDIMSSRLREAYERERKVTRVLIRMERRGVPIDVRGLERDIPIVEAAQKKIDEGLLKRMKVPKREWEEFKWAGPKFADRLISSGIVDHLPLTEKGNPSVSAESLAEVLPAKVAKEFEVRSQIQTCLQTFMRPWLEMGRETNGMFYARFNQVRDNGESTGARTGRLSMTPNLQNMIRGDKDPRVPKLRTYIVALLKGRIIKRDYSQQELRLLAHFEDDAYSRETGQMGPFRRAYEENPELDAHMLVKGLIFETTRLELERRPVKDLNFGLIYGQGLPLTAEKMGVTLEEAKRARAAHAASLPGIPILQKELKQRVKDGQPIWTWGGRRYYCEPPAFAKGRWMTFDYKMLNKLIQGSAADCTKEAMVNYDSTDIADEHPLILQVHDELLALLMNLKAERKVHETMRDCMADVAGINIPMLSDGSTGKNYGAMKDVKW